MNYLCHWLIGSYIIISCFGCGQIQDPALQAGETFIDGFYSWQPERLDRLLLHTSAEARAQALYYQAWAEAGGYAIKVRQPCSPMSAAQVTKPSQKRTIACPVTATDNIGKALGYVASDTFTLTVRDDQITNVSFAADDPPVFDALFVWMQTNRSDVFAGPCKDMFAGGTTPAACVREVIDAANVYAATLTSESGH